MTISSSARLCSAGSPARTNSPRRCRRAAAWCFQMLNRTGLGTSQGEPVANGGVVVALMLHLPLTEEWQGKRRSPLQVPGASETPYERGLYAPAGWGNGDHQSRFVERGEVVNGREAPARRLRLDG